MAAAQRLSSAAGVLNVPYEIGRHASRLETVVGALHQQQRLAESEPLTRCGVTQPTNWPLRSLA